MHDDVSWFKQRLSRQARIRQPGFDEFTLAWQMIGDHDASRRRVLVWRVPKNNPGRKMIPDGLMRIPFLAFADESIQDSDAVLLPILDDIMKEAAKAEKIGPGFVRTGDADSERLDELMRRYS